MSTNTVINPEELKQRIRDLLHSYYVDEPTKRRHLRRLRAYARQLPENRPLDLLPHREAARN
ncbi:MAG: hypothetical protein ACRDYA_00220 [Egibacteraceae bacterium]